MSFGKRGDARGCGAGVLAALLPLLACRCAPEGGLAGDAGEDARGETPDALFVDADADAPRDGDASDTDGTDRAGDPPVEPADAPREDGGSGEPFCGDGACAADETRASCPADCPPCDYSRPPTDAPLFLFYGYFSDSNYMPTSTNDVLFTPLLENVETVFHVSAINFVAGETSGAGDGDACAPPRGKFAEWRDKGVRLAKHVVAKSDLMCMLTGHPYSIDDPSLCERRLGWNRCYGPSATASPGAACAAEVLAAQLRNGYDYISVDELYEGVIQVDRTYPDGVKLSDLSWNNGHMASERFIELLRLLAGMGYDNRVLVWVEYHTMQIGAAASTNGRLWSLKDIWDACHDEARGTHCRKIFFEVYGNEPACLVTSRVIGASTYLNLDNIAVRASRLGIGSIAAIGVGTYPDALDGYNGNHACDLAPDHGLSCPATGSHRGSLRLQFGRMHGHTEWRGAAFYSLGRAEATGAWSLADLAASLRGYIAWWDANPG